tara:strand:+ start:8134 stop:10131 length:1998 start_codon:yes stop_codon:yes gene_type:complete
MQGVNDNMNLILSEAILAHECAGHLAYTNFNAWKVVSDAIKRGDEDRLLHDFTNIFEDARVNYLLGKDFAGSKKRLDMAQHMMMDHHRATIGTGPAPDSEAPKLGVVAIATEAILGVGHFIDNAKVIAMMDEARPLFAGALKCQDTTRVIKGARAVLAVYRTHFPEDETGGSEYGASTSPEGEGLFVDDMSMDNVAEAANTQKRNKQQAKTVRTSRFKDMDIPTSDNAGEGGLGSADEDGDSSEGGAEAGEAGDGSEGDGEGQEGTDSDSEGQGTGGEEGDAEGKGTGEGSPMVAETADDDFGGNEFLEVGDNHDAGLKVGATGSSDARFNGIDYAENLLAEAQGVFDESDDLWFPEDVDLCDLTADIHNADAAGVVNDGGHGIITGENEHWRQYSMDLQANEYNIVKTQTKGAVKRLAATLKNLIRGADTRYSTHHKKGKIDDSRLWAVKSSERLFKKDKVHPDFTLRCVVLIDASGSMSGRRARQAAKAAVALSEALEMVGADYEVVDFNSSNGAMHDWPRGCTYINTRKSANQSLTTEVKGRIVTPFAGSQNSDAYAVRWAMERTKQFGDTDSKRMVFIISDGSPAGPSKGGGAGAHLREVLAEAETDDCILFSVGIAGMDTSGYYANHGHASINGIDTLAQDILLPLKTALKRSLNRRPNR